MPPITAATWGTVYLLHLHQRLGNLSNARAQAQHYIGWCQNIDERLAQHRAGQGSKLLATAVARGITFEVAATWSAPVAFEKYLKRRKESPRLCITCCTAHGWICKHVASPTHVQLALPFPRPALELPELPTPPVLRMDRYELLLTLGFRQARPAAQPSGHIDDDLL